MNTESSQSTNNVPVSDGGQKRKNIPVGLWTKCPDCQHVIFNKALREIFSVCPKCNYHFIVGIEERIEQLIDSDTFEEFDALLESSNPLNFKGKKTYDEKIKQDKKKTGLRSACVIGTGCIIGKKIAFGGTDSRFIMGSMGSVVGEKIARLAEYALKAKLPMVIVSGSGGGARMYEGMFSLMQMAKTSAAIARFQEANVPFISVLTNPTMGGVMASFASLGDIIIAEPCALLGFAGPRVIEQTIKQKLPEGFQTSEFLLEHGMIDIVCERPILAERIKQLLDYLMK
ncbi:MAG: acetyl-CoA carboxylase, carboxyltransferase subunit beta [Candidatus Omnitrophica bacterium]|nr:acetyl-CoA carboxylase, carboxyltransferase subunit beta [Candidatus Omnitrophota bacterium]